MGWTERKMQWGESPERCSIWYKSVRVRLRLILQTRGRPTALAKQRRSSLEITPDHEVIGTQAFVRGLFKESTNTLASELLLYASLQDP